jgi:tRNA threonylcarbamoyladenosine biosynthesis protein TsaE
MASLNCGLDPFVQITRSPEETEQLGRFFGESLTDGSIVCFFGELGAGKTTFIRGLVNGAAHVDGDCVTSPTFVYLNIYEGKTPVYHFDLYRLQSAREFVAMGFDEYLGASGICCLEWSERIEELLPANVIRVEMKHIDQTQREIQIYS